MAQLNNEQKENLLLIPTQKEAEQALTQLVALRKDRAKKIDEFIADLQPINSK
jgi:hypothetical protein